MSFKHFIVRSFAKAVKKSTIKMGASALKDQNRIFNSLIKKASNTKFGLDHGFNSIKTHKDFCTKVPIRNYEEIRHYVEDIIAGQEDILWPGKPKYFAKTSGTTSGVKYIPISKESIKFHIKTARNTILNYIADTGADIFSKKMIFLSGSPTLESVGGIKTGRLSGIVNHEIPSWIRPNQLPSFETNCIEEWETKLDKIVQETIDMDMSLISGIPPWIQMYYEQLLEKSKCDSVKELFPSYQLFIHGGVNFQPYNNILKQLAGEGVDTIETYPASEGFIAFQDNLYDENLLLNSNAMMFFEFVAMTDISQQSPTRLLLDQVELNKDYAVIVSSNAGLWAYNIGDTIRFYSLDPYKIKVSGRIAHFISAFGEHVIAKEVEESMAIISKKLGFHITEFTVAPNIQPTDNSLAHHEWFIEFDVQSVQNLEAFAKALDGEMTRQNIYYKDLIDGGILSPLKIRALQKNAFRDYMKSEGKLGGQNKVPRLTNDRIIAEKLIKYAL